jgi:hypothetical protein
MDLILLYREVQELKFTNDYDPKMKMTSTQAKFMQYRFGPLVMEAANEIAQLRSQDVLNIMVNKLPAGVYVNTHVDPLPATKYQGPLPHVERWHLPIVTDLKCLLSGEHLVNGFWHGPIRYWEPHDVQGGQYDRIHLVVDLDTPVRIE